jgi:beta-glucosidase
MASLINSGTAPIKKGDRAIIRFYVDGKEVARYYSKSINIPVGGMELACAQGLKEKNWVASNGKFSLEARIEVAGNSDLNMQNNACEAELLVPDGRVIPVEVAKILVSAAGEN